MLSPAIFSPSLPARDEDAWFRRLKLWIEDPAARATLHVKLQPVFVSDASVLAPSDEGGSLEHA